MLQLRIKPSGVAAIVVCYSIACLAAAAQEPAPGTADAQPAGPEPNPYMSGTPGAQQGGYPNQNGSSSQPPTSYAAPQPYSPTQQSYGPPPAPAGASGYATPGVVPYGNAGAGGPPPSPYYQQPYYAPPSSPAGPQNAPGAAQSYASGPAGLGSSPSSLSGYPAPSLPPYPAATNGSPYSAGQPPGQPQPAIPGYSTGSWAVLSQLRSMVRSGKVREALPVAYQYISLKPAEPEGYFWLGVILDNTNHPAEALRNFEAGVKVAVNAGMDSAELRMNTGNELMKLGRVSDAIQQYKRAKEVDPELAIVDLNLGRAYLEAGEIEAALKCFQRCEDLHFQPPQLAYYRVKALRKAGRLEEAGKQVSQVIGPGSETETTRRLRQEFSDLLK